MRLSALSGNSARVKPQHRGIMGNHRHKLREVDPIIRETQAAVPSHTHTFFTYYSLEPLREPQQQLSEGLNVRLVVVGESGASSVS